MDQQELDEAVADLEEEMFSAAEQLNFEYAAKLRDQIKELVRSRSAK